MVANEVRVVKTDTNARLTAEVRQGFMAGHGLMPWYVATVRYENEYRPVVCEQRFIRDLETAEQVAHDMLVGARREMIKNESEQNA